MPDVTEPEPLPGLELTDPTRGTSPLERGVRRTIAAHADKLTDRDAGRLAVALELAQVATRKRASGRMSTVSNDLRLLTEILESLDPDAGESGVDDELRRAMDEWARVNGGDHGPAGSTTEIQHPA